jgi:multiple sugar transport system ATP-binding protein
VPKPERRAIVRDPDVFLMDEPLSNLDATLRSQMRTELQSLQQELDVTTIYVTHDQTEAMTMADRIAIMNDGKLQQVGTPLECYHQPTNEFVAGFIGSPSMNFLDVTADGDTLVHGGFSYELRGDTRSALSGVADQYRLGIRPETIQIADDDETNVIVAKVNAIEPMGDQTHLYVDVGGETVTVTMDGKLTFEPGETVRLTFEETDLHLFDIDTGENLTLAKSTDEGGVVADATS